MRALLRSIIDDLREGLGEPVTLLRALEQHPQMLAQLKPPTRCIAASSVTAWHEMGVSGPIRPGPRELEELMGWKGTDRRDYRSYTTRRPEYAQLVRLEIIESWSCDLQQLHGFCASKSDLTAFASMDEMVERNSPEMIDEVSPAKLSRNLAHKEIRILHRATTSDHFTWYAWDGRLWLMNSGGSHHLAAAKYIAARLGVPVPLRGKLYVYTLDAEAVRALRARFEIFLIATEAQAFDDAMRAAAAHWIGHALPRPHTNARVALLPRDHERSMRVARVLREAGAFDLGCHLGSVAASQRRTPVPGTAHQASG